MVLKMEEKNIVEEIGQENRRDGRDFESFREIEIIPNYLHSSAEGSAFVKLGETKVLVGVKCSTDTPYPDSPDEGTLITNAELAPIASPDYEAGPPQEDTVEIARVVDRGIRESGMIDLNDLCIEEGEKVWSVFIDLHVLDYDGNLIDACSLGALAALHTAKMPKYNEEDGTVDYTEREEDLPVEGFPVTATGRKIAGKLLFDTTADEESVLGTRLTVTIKEDGNICSMQKGETEPLTADEILEIVDKVKDKVEPLRQEVKDVL